MAYTRVVVSTVAVYLTASLSSMSVAREITIEERIDAQRAIEQVYWNHRIWPKDNPGPKPPLSAVLSDAAIRSRVEDYLKKSNALDKWWRRPISATQLQAEMDRMARQTRDGALLSELFAALGNDPQLIAETLVRQSLADRLARNWYGSDSRFHAETKHSAEAAVAACSNVACMKSMTGTYSESTWHLRAEAPSTRTEDDQVVSFGAKEWKDKLQQLARSLDTSPAALPTLKLGRLEETPEAFVVTAVLARAANEIKTASVHWAKTPFDAWWARESNMLEARAPIPAGTIAPVAPSGSACVDDTWTRTVASAPDPVTGHTAVWTGSEMIIWGGSQHPDYVNGGARYNPATDTWTPTSSVGAPSARAHHTAVWTGTGMIVWGGTDGTGFNTGGRYDPSTDSWTPTSTGVNVPSGRVSHTAVWTGIEMVVWGGTINAVYTNTGGRYDPFTDSWVTASTTGAPTARANQTAVWTGTQMIVWGGFVGLNDNVNTGGMYDPLTDSWAPTSVGTNVPNPGFDHTAVWTGSEMIVWGSNQGARYAPTTDTWLPTSVGANLPSSRAFHTAVWTGTEMIIWGGWNGPEFNTGGRYNPSTDSWLPTSTGANVPPGRSSHTAVWTGSEMIVWGGSKTNSNYVVGTGGRYDPVTDSWVRTSTGAGVPAPRRLHTTVWTGAEMIVWGGLIDGLGVGTGSRYDPALDAWTATSTAINVPAARSSHSAVWTGTEMIVWGGKTNNHPPNTEENTGGRYNPTTDAWLPTTTGGIVPPSPRFNHSAVWTGTLMIVWGGEATAGLLNNGARYDPSTNTWLFPPMASTGLSARRLHTAVWSGTHMIIWGGLGFGGGPLISGGRYNPATNSWLSMVFGASVPTGRSDYAAVWSGTHLIVWGGRDSTGQVATGGRYDPVADTWSPTSMGPGSPYAREQHVAVWTGSEMIVWGGKTDLESGFEYFLSDGAAYNPVSDAWRTASMGPNNPGILDDAEAIWTGSQMIVWGGQNSANGGLYCGACSSPSTWYADFDSDSFGDPSVSQEACSHPAWYVSVAGDCDDTDAERHPGAAETCDNQDDDCDAQIDEGVTTPTACGTGPCVSTGFATCVAGVYTNDNCTPGTPPSPTDTTCDAVDDDCSGQADEDYAGVPPTCGIGGCQRTGTISCVNGAIQESCTPGTPASNDVTCNGVDDNCNGQLDEQYMSKPDGWVATSLTGVPTARSQFVAVSTGTTMMVWGGFVSSSNLNTGGVYTPATDSWFPINTAGAPTARRDSAGVWTGTEMIVWGGDDGATFLSNGGRYNPATFTWTATSLFPLEGRSLHTAVWTNSRMIVWGGRHSAFGQINNGASYNPSTNSWTTLSTINAPGGRFNHTAIWTGTRMIVWGGELVGGAVAGDGKIYDPGTDTWSNMATLFAPSPRARHTAIWTGSRMIVFGGTNGAGQLGDGASYDPTANTWTPIAPLAIPRSRHVAVWDPLHSLMIVFGGVGNSTYLFDAYKFDPVAGTWVAIAPMLVARQRAAGFWFGNVSQMVIWGGDSGAFWWNNGARYTVAPFTCGLGPCTRQSGSTCNAGVEGYGCTPGPPSPETCNQVDDNCDGTTDNNVGGTPGDPCLQAGKGGMVQALTTNVRWTAISGAISYDVIRGGLSTLRSSAGNYTSATLACLANDLAATSVNEVTDPPANDAFFHLLRANFSGGPGTYNETNPKQVGSRDGEIAASPNACP